MSEIKKVMGGFRVEGPHPGASAGHFGRCEALPAMPLCVAANLRRRLIAEGKPADKLRMVMLPDEVFVGKVDLHKAV